MKKFYLFTLAVAGLMAAACTPTEEQEQVPAPEQAYLSYFGFQAAEGVFAAEVKVESPEAGSTIKFETPVGTSEEAYKALVPIFEVTDPTAVVTDAEGQVIESGVAYDFSKDVDIYVTVSNAGGEKTSMYTISVQAKGALTWYLAAEGSKELADSTKGDVVMAINPVDNLPYIATKLYGAGGQYGMVYKFDGTGLKPAVGNSPIFNEQKADVISMGFDKAGAVYAAYREYNVKNHTSVVKLADNKATFLSDSTGAAFAPYPGNPAAIFPAGDNGIWVAQQAGNDANGIAKRTLSLSKWNGSSWETGKTISPERPAADYAYYTIAAHSKGVDYLMTYNQNSNSVSIYKLDAEGAWSTVVEGLKLLNTAGAEAQTYLSYNMDFDVASNGDIYICLGADFSEAGVYNVAVVRYRPSDQSQTIIGGVTEHLKNKDRYFSIALDANDTPYLAFRNNLTGEDKLYVRYIDNKTKNWSAPVCISSNAVAAPIIRFSEDGEAFIAVQNDDNKRVQIYKAN